MNGLEPAARQGEFWPVQEIPRRILFHKDFDGICSAALLVAFFETEVTLQPVHYGLKKSWLRKKLPRAAVVDFLFHPDALWWFDHHETTFVEPSLQTAYKADARHRWDTSYSSCPALILDVLGESVNVSSLAGTMSEWIHWSSVIDGAEYRDAEQAVLGSEPAILVNQALAQSPSPNLRTLLVHKIAQGLEPKAVANNGAVAPHWSTWRRRTSQALAVMERRLQTLGPVGFCDVTDAEIPFVRYGVYYFVPDVPYSVIAYKSQRGPRAYWISLSANPWVNSQNNPVNLGALAGHYGGGGRRNVGAIGLASRSKCRSVAREIAVKLSEDSALREED